MINSLKEIDEEALVQMDNEELVKLNGEITDMFESAKYVKELIDDEIKTRKDGEECDFTDTDFKEVKN